MTYYDIRPSVLRGDKDTGKLQSYHPAMNEVVESCAVEFPKVYASGRDGWWGLCMVSAKSSLSYRRALETLGVYFTREMGYDFRLFTADEFTGRPRERSTDQDTRGFFWYHGFPGEWMTFGGCCFRLRKLRVGEDVIRVWYLMWVWMHPYARRHGHLTRYWPFFQSMFGNDFCLETPLSPSMLRFICKHSHNPANISWEEEVESESNQGE